MRLSFVLLAACGIDRDIEAGVHVEQGVYGQLTASDAYGPFALTDSFVGVFEPDTNIKLWSTTSNDDGVYELSLPPETVQLCLTDEGCSPTRGDAASCCLIVGVPVGRVREDLEWPQTGPHWCDGPCFGP